VLEQAYRSLICRFVFEPLHAGVHVLFMHRVEHFGTLD
jgi:hypothetical protein